MNTSEFWARVDKLVNQHQFTVDWWARSEDRARKSVSSFLTDVDLLSSAWHKSSPDVERDNKEESKG